MNRLYLLLFFSFLSSGACHAQDIDKVKIQEDLEELLSDIESSYAYLDEKKIDLACLRERYTKRIQDLKAPVDVTLFFEYLLYELYDSHVILGTNNYYSYRLFAPVHVMLTEDVPVITHVWQEEYAGIDENIIGATVNSMNGIKIGDAIDNFYTTCQDKKDPIIRQWLANKVLFGRYSEPRVLDLTLNNGQSSTIDLDSLDRKQHNNLVNSQVIGDIGILTIENSLGNPNTIEAFDNKLTDVKDTKGLILDLRNTVDGGDSYIARAIMGHFITTSQPYQVHSYMEDYGNHPPIERLWKEYVTPRGLHYDGPVVVLVGRWTGSMGEGLAIGMEGIEAGEVIGTEMQELAGGISGFGFRHQSFGYRLSVQKLFHVDGTPREKYIPTHPVTITSNLKNEAFDKTIDILKIKIAGE